MIEAQETTKHWIILILKSTVLLYQEAAAFAQWLFIKWEAIWYKYSTSNFKADSYLPDQSFHQRPIAQTFT